MEFLSQFDIYLTIVALGSLVATYLLCKKFGETYDNESSTVFAFFAVITGILTLVATLRFTDDLSYNKYIGYPITSTYQIGEYQVLDVSEIARGDKSSLVICFAQACPDGEGNHFFRVRYWEVPNEVVMRQRGNQNIIRVSEADCLKYVTLISDLPIKRIVLPPLQTAAEASGKKQE